jgi:hypothetical protein
MITAEHWKEIEKNLASSFGRVVLKVDNYQNVTLEVRFMKSLKYCIMVFLDGQSKFSWGQKDCEERRRFCCETKRHLYPKKMRDQAQKKLRLMGKEWVERTMQTYSMFFPCWTSFTKLKRHLLKNNKELTVLSIGYKDIPQTNALSTAVASNGSQERPDNEKIDKAIPPAASAQGQADDRGSSGHSGNPPQDSACSTASSTQENACPAGA